MLYTNYINREQVSHTMTKHFPFRSLSSNRLRAQQPQQLPYFPRKKNHHLMLTTTAYRVYSIYHRLARSETLALCVCVCLLFVCTRTQPSLWVTFTRHRRVALLRAPVYFHRASFRPRAAWCMLVGFMIRTDTTDADSYICRRCHRA